LLEALGNIGDFIGGLGVVVTLAYLAVQIRHNTRGLDHNAGLMRLSYENEVRREGLELRALIASSPDLSALWVRAVLGGDDDLDPTESARVWLLMGNIAAILKAEFDAQQRDDFQFDSSQFLRLVARGPGFRKFWAQRSTTATHEFDRYVEAILDGHGSEPAGRSAAAQQGVEPDAK
jgi:hypothetical protein